MLPHYTCSGGQTPGFTSKMAIAVSGAVSDTVYPSLGADDECRNGRSLAVVLSFALNAGWPHHVRSSHALESAMHRGVIRC